MKNLTWRIPVNWTRRAIVEVSAESFDEAVSEVDEMLMSTSDTEIKRNMASKTKSIADIPWSYEVDIDACDIYQTAQALAEMHTAYEKKMDTNEA